MPTTTDELRAVTTYPRDAVLDAAHVCVAIGISLPTLEKLDLPCFYAGNRVRYIWGQVLDALAEKASPDARPQPAPRQRRRKPKAQGPAVRVVG